MKQTSRLSLVVKISILIILVCLSNMGQWGSKLLVFKKTEFKASAAK